MTTARRTGDLLRDERHAKGWSTQQLAVELHRHMTGDGTATTAVDNIRRNIERWEQDHVVPNAAYQAALAKAFGYGIKTLFRDDGPAQPHRLEGVDLVELAGRLSSSNITPAVLDELRRLVTDIGVRYSSVAPAVLLPEAAHLYQVLIEALNGPATVEQHVELKHWASWLVLITGCLLNDQGDRRPAEAMVRIARDLAIESGSDVQHAWTWEMPCWFGLTDGDAASLRKVVELSRHAQSIAPPTADVQLQLKGQEAEALARLGRVTEARRVMEAQRDLADHPALTYPVDDLDFHCAIDPDKGRKGVMRVAVFTGDGEFAEHNAVEIIRLGMRSDGTHRQPMRVTDALMTRAIVAADRGDTGGAVRFVDQALSIPRLSVPSTQLTLREVIDRMPQCAERVDLVGRFQALGRSEPEPAV